MCPEKLTICLKFTIFWQRWDSNLCLSDFRAHGLNPLCSTVVFCLHLKHMTLYKGWLVSRTPGREVQREFFPGAGRNQSYLDTWELQNHVDQRPLAPGISRFASLTVHLLLPISSTCSQGAAVGLEGGWEGAGICIDS